MHHLVTMLSRLIVSTWQVQQFMHTRNVLCWNGLSLVRQVSVVLSEASLAMSQPATSLLWKSHKGSQLLTGIYEWCSATFIARLLTNVSTTEPLTFPKVCHKERLARDALIVANQRAMLAHKAFLSPICT